MGARRRSRGVSLVGLLVGTAIGLIVVAAAGTLAAAHLSENRRLLADARLMQDLRTAADIVARDLRRAGHWGSAASAVRSDDGGAALVNPYSAIASAPGGVDGLVYRYSQDAVENQALDRNEHFGFRLRAGVLDIQLGEGNWQALTDSTRLVMTDFTVEARSVDIDLARFCSAPCAAGSSRCPPRQQVRSVTYSMSARSTLDPTVRRTVRGSARLRNDALVGHCEG